MAGMTMWVGPSWRSWMIHSPRSVSVTSRPCASRWSLRWVSSAVMDLDLTMVLTPFSLAMRAMISLASWAVAARWTLVPAASAWRLNSS
ncbi:hypothetical protein DSECCO2_450300 [anaerobic digester metagenome]